MKNKLFILACLLALTQVAHASTDTIYIHDTVIVVVQDTTTVIEYIYDTNYVDVPYQVHDTLYNHLDTIYVTVTDTIWKDTVWHTQTDTLWLNDTVIVYDTIVVSSEGICGLDGAKVRIYRHGGRLIVEGMGMNNVTLYDAGGRVLEEAHPSFGPAETGSLDTWKQTTWRATFDISQSGVYKIKIGDAPVRRIVVAE